MIHFVGAGSGAIDLITVRGMHLLEQADCVIYAGSLVNPQLLDYCKNNPEIYNSATMNLEEVLDILISRADMGKNVVRLHTGDPALYGAIGEQMDELKKRGIEYDVTPGITAAFSAAAALKMEMTLPGITQTVIFTRMVGRTGVPEREAIENISRIGATMAIYLSASLAEELSSKLLLGGYKENTPVAICHKVSWPDEKIIITDLTNMAEAVKDNNLELTTLFLVGECIGATDFEKSKLYDKSFETIFRKAE